MIDVVRRTWGLFEETRRWRWAVVVLLGVSVSMFETVGAMLIYVLLQFATAPDVMTLPILGDLQARYPGVPRDRMFLYLSVGIAAFFVLRSTTVMLQSYVQNRVAQGASAALADRIVRGYLSMPYRMHLTRNSAEMTRNALQSAGEIAVYVLVPAASLVSDALVVVGLVTVLLLSAPNATALALIVLLPVVLVVLKAVQPRLAALGVVSQDEYAVSLKTLQQSLGGVRDIKILSKEAFFLRLFSASRHRQARAQYIRATYVELPRVIVETVLVLFLVGYMALITLRGGDTAKSFAVLGLFGFAAIRLLPALNRIIAAVNALRYGEAAVRNVDAELVDIAAAIEQATTQRDRQLVPFQETLRIENVSFGYLGATELVLEDVSLTLRRGESLGVVGATGAGKTTLVDVLVGLLEPDAGRVTVDGVDIADNVAGWQANIGIVPQTVFLLDDTLRRNIALGLPDEQIDQVAMSEATRLAQLDPVVMGLPEGMDTRVGERGVRLSGGQRQRVAIARALYRRPALLVFDEGTSALDTLTESDLTNAIETLRGERTIIMVAHRLSTIRRCDQIVLLDKGRLVDTGTFDDLLARNGEFRALAAMA